MRLICMLIQDMFIILGSIVSTFEKACEITYRERWILLQWPTINLLSIIPHFGLEMSIVVIHNCWPNHKYHHLNFQFWQFLIQSKRSKACVELESWVEICTCHNPKCVYIYIYIYMMHIWRVWHAFDGANLNTIGNTRDRATHYKSDIWIR